MMAHLEAAVNSFQRWLDIQRTRLLDKLGKAEEGFELGGHGVEKRRCEYVHALHVREPELIILLSVWVA